jgi:predicted nucleotidyltransferase
MAIQASILRANNALFPASFCHRWKIHELSLFGSVLRDDFGPASDIDVLVTFDDDAQTSGLCHLTGMIARICGTC